jgi:hypothetical protein
MGTGAGTGADADALEPEPEPAPAARTAPWAGGRASSSPLMSMSNEVPVGAGCAA